ncbi:MAG: class I SAM-dependent methyltransferase [Symploca sp. SIO2G7]|nr:class I SAM-dependent methyltransferase [Symploca sp. SIO2G7]
MVESKLTGIPRTMLMTTRARVEEHQRQNGLFQDPQAAQWWQSLQWDTDLDSIYEPIAQFSWSVRAYLFDQIAQRHIAAHKEAIAIELGAGLSTRYYRVGQDYRYWFELDLPETTAVRRQLDTETDTHRFLAQSALDLSWMEEIPVEEPQNLLIIAEGLLMYFEMSQVQSFIDQLRRRFPGATLAFDTFGKSPKSKTAKQLAQLGAPLKWFNQNERDIAAMGLSLVQVRSLIQENCRYPDRIGIYRWVSWLSKLPPLRNASLILETTL